MILVSRQHPADASKRIRVFSPAARVAEEAGVPVRALEDFWDGVHFDARVLEVASVLFLHLLDANLGAAAVRAAVQAAKQAGVPVVVDTDDDYFAPADHGVFDAALAAHVPVMGEILAAADHVIATGPYLAQTLASRCRHVTTVPNVVDDELLRPRKATRPRVGFAGGPTHVRDLCMVLPAVAQVQTLVDFDFVLFGLYDRDMRTTMERLRGLSSPEREAAGLSDVGALADALAPVRYVHVPSAPFDRFMKTLSALDLSVGLCPLLDTHFNRCRSSIKFYQYAAVGTVALCSAAGPYESECAPVCENGVEAWTESILELVSDLQRLQSVQRSQADQLRRSGRFASVRETYQRLLLGDGVCSKERLG